MKNEFKDLFVAGNLEEAAKKIDSNLNTPIFGCYAFELLLTRKEKVAKELLNKIVTHPNWNPNYRLIDGWTPLERAILNHREDVAKKILKHPQLKERVSPKLINLSKINGTKTFQKFISAQMQKQR